MRKREKYFGTAFPFHQAGAENTTLHLRLTPKTPEATVRKKRGIVHFWQNKIVMAAMGELDGCSPYFKRKSKFMKKHAKTPKHPRIRLRETVAKEAREIQDKARRLSTLAMERAGDILADKTSQDSDALKAAELILNRAYGKPNQTNTNLNVDANGKHTEVSSVELNERIKNALERVEALTGGAAKAPQSKKQPADIRERDRNPNGSDPRLH